MADDQGAFRVARDVLLEGGPHPHEAFTERDWSERVARATADRDGPRLFANSAWPLGYARTRRQAIAAKGKPVVIWTWRDR